MDRELLKWLLKNVLAPHKGLMAMLAIVLTVAISVYALARAVEATGNARHAWRDRSETMQRRSSYADEGSQREEPHHPRDRGE